MAGAWDAASEPRRGEASADAGGAASPARGLRPLLAGPAARANLAHPWLAGHPDPVPIPKEPCMSGVRVLVGTRKGAIFKTTDGGKSWSELPGLRSAKGKLWQPGAGGMCLHTIVLDPKHKDRMFVAISAAGAFRSDDGGQSWRPVTKGLVSKYELPDPTAEVGHCVHCI